jgi:hypothetical protein
MALRSATASPKAGSALTASRCRGSQARVGGALCLPVSRGGPLICGYHAAVDVSRWPGCGQVVMVAGVPVAHWLHDGKVARVP